MTAVDAARREVMRSMVRILDQESFCGVLATGYCAATKRTENYYFSFVKSVITENV